MKNLRSLFLLLTFIGLGAAFTACGGHSHEGEQGKEYTSAYICPMACAGSGSEEPGKCPVCGMDYVKNENTTEDGHSHDGNGHDHDGHSHDGHDHDHGDHDGHDH